MTFPEFCQSIFTRASKKLAEITEKLPQKFSSENLLAQMPAKYVLQPATATFGETRLLNSEGQAISHADD